MAFSQGSRSGLSYVVESTFGTTPASPAMIDLPFNTHSLGLTKELVESEEIRSDRQIAVSRHGNKQVSGDIVVEFRASDFDDLLESAFFNLFDTSELRVGTTPQYMTIEDRAEDITQYRQFTGCAVNSMSMTIAPNAMVLTTFNLIGKGMTQASSPLDASITDASGNAPFDSFTGTIEEGGSTIAIVTGLEFTLDNQLAPTFVIGDSETPQLEFGRAAITGNIQAYYEDATLLNKFINETESSMIVNLGDGAGNNYQFEFPRIKYNGSDVPVDNEQSRIISLPFQALRDTTEETNLVLRTA